MLDLRGHAAQSSNTGMVVETAAGSLVAVSGVENGAMGD